MTHPAGGPHPVFGRRDQNAQTQAPPGIKNAVQTTSKTEDLKSALEGKPRAVCEGDTDVFHGVKVGFQKSKANSPGT
jgi:hypothetical protein